MKLQAPLIIVDCGMGNLHSVESAVARIGKGARTTGDPEIVRNGRQILLPGVGSFGDAMETLRASGLRDALHEAVRAGARLAGICLGLQILFQRGSEKGTHEGLGFFDGEVVRMEGAPKVPHMGWNTLDVVHGHPVLAGLEPDAHVYFAHSYVARPASGELVLATTEHGATFPSVVGRGNILGLQFHPEKSQAVGLRILRGVIDWLAEGS